MYLRHALSWRSERFGVAIANTDPALKQPEALVEKIELWDEQIWDALDQDPNKLYTMAQHDAAIEHLKGFVFDRAAFVDSWLAQGGHCP